MHVFNLQQLHPWILVIFYLAAAFSLLETPNMPESQTTSEEQDSEEFEIALLKNLRNDYRNGFVELMNFVNSINDTLTDLKTENALRTAEIVGLKAEIASQNQEIIELKKVITILYNPNLGISWEQFDRFIRIIPTKVKTGNSFNGLSISDFKSQASQVNTWGSYTAVVFVNYLDKAIQDFQIYDPYNFANILAPKSIPPHTREIFTFTNPSNHAAETSFSYTIGSAQVRIAAISFYAERGAGLAFVSNDTNMKTYYETKKGIQGSYAFEHEKGVDKNLSVGYNNLHARMFVKHEGYWQATLHIELIQLPL